MCLSVKPSSQTFARVSKRILFYKYYIWNIELFLPRVTFVNNQWTKDATRRVVFKLFIYYLYPLKCGKCVREECIIFKNVMIKNIIGTKCDVFLTCVFVKHWYSIMRGTIWHNITTMHVLYQKYNRETESTDLTITANLKCYVTKDETWEVWSKAEFKCSSLKRTSPPSKKHGKAVLNNKTHVKPPTPPTDKKHLHMPHPI